MRALPFLASTLLVLAGCTAAPTSVPAPPEAHATDQTPELERLDGSTAPRPDQAPRGWLSASVAAGPAPLAVTFDVHVAGLQEPAAWRLMAGEVGLAAQQGDAVPVRASIRHVFDVPGEHAVRLEVDDGAWRATFELAVNVSAPWGLEVPWGGLDAPLRPGASLGGYCTFNFLFHDAWGRAYVGTAAHCTELNETVELPGTGDVGVVVYDSDDDAGADASVDFALIELLPDAVPQANPTMLGYDGPVGAAEPDTGRAGDLVGIHGYGMVLGDSALTRDRQGVLVSNDGRTYTADMPAVWGDSGSPILHLDSGKAFGIVSRFGFDALPPTTDQGPTLAFILEELAKAGWVVTLTPLQA